MFREQLVLTTKEELLRFLYILPFLKLYISGRVDLTKALKTSIIEEVIKTTIAGKSRTTRAFKEFKQDKIHQEAFNRIKRDILENAYSRG